MAPPRLPGEAGTDRRLRVGHRFSGPRTVMGVPAIAMIQTSMGARLLLERPVLFFMVDHASAGKRRPMKVRRCRIGRDAWLARPFPVVLPLLVAASTLPPGTGSTPGRRAAGAADEQVLPPWQMGASVCRSSLRTGSDAPTTRLARPPR